jgi:hypothetical protein
MRVWIVLALLLIPSCQSTANRSTLPRRAAKDLSCPEASLRIIDLYQDAAGVVGCGKKATYIHECKDRAGRKCAWVLNSSGDTQYPPAKP